MDSTPQQSRVWLSRLAALGVTGVALYLVFNRLDLPALREAFGRLRPLWFLAGVLAYGALFLSSGPRWHAAARLTGCAVHFGASARCSLIGHFYTLILFGVAGGDVAKCALYARWFRLPLPEVLATATLDRMLSFSGLLILAVPTVVLAAVSGAFSKQLHIQVPGWWLVVGGIICLAGVLVLTKWRPRSERAGFRWIRSTGGGIRQLLAAPRDAVPALFAALIAQICLSSALAFSLAAVSSQPLPWSKLLWTFPLITLMSGIPMTVAGLGVREGASLALFGLYGVAAADAVAAALLTMTINLFWVLMGGLLNWREEELFNRHADRRSPESISVVIPTLNEETEIAETVRRAKAVPEVREIIVVDGGSAERTRQLAEELGCRVMESPAGRGRQMRLGAESAIGDVVLFVHAGTWLPTNAGQAIFAALRDRTVSGGALWKVFRDPTWLRRGSRARCALWMFGLHRAFVDQALFARRDALAAVGGIPDIPLMEEFELCRRLRQVGRITLAGATVSTSMQQSNQRNRWGR